MNKKNTYIIEYSTNDKWELSKGVLVVIAKNLNEAKVCFKHITHPNELTIIEITMISQFGHFYHIQPLIE